jgi:hypothetical protein
MAIAPQRWHAAMLPTAAMLNLLHAAVMVCIHAAPAALLLSAGFP